MRQPALRLSALALAALLVGCGQSSAPPAATTAPSTPAAATAPAEVPLISREALFGNPARAGGAISPNGEWLGYIAPREGVLTLPRQPRHRRIHAAAGKQRVHRLRGR
jgi:hypothetical protein